jgi:GH24 family phage-related lysozyme (muramidase)
MLLRTIGYGEIIGIKPAKKLFDEQKEHLIKEKKEGAKIEEVTKKIEEVSISDNKA